MEWYTITFELQRSDRHLRVERRWGHVPSVNDRVTLDVLDGEAVFEVTRTVHRIRWLDSGHDVVIELN